MLVRPLAAVLAGALLLGAAALAEEPKAPPAPGGPGKPEKAPAANEWTFNRFQYDAANNVAFLVTGTRDWRVDVWAYRYRKPAAGGGAAK